MSLQVAMSVVLSVCLSPHPSFIPGGLAHTGPRKGPAAHLKYEGRMRMMINIYIYIFLKFFVLVLLSAQLKRFGGLTYAGFLFFITVIITTF